jgi:hypothetical protein
MRNASACAMTVSSPSTVGIAASFYAISSRTISERSPVCDSSVPLSTCIVWFFVLIRMF